MIAYIACPYSHSDPLVRQMRFTQVSRVAARLMLKGEVVFSPISHSHPIEQYGMDEPQGYDFWMDQDLPILRKCSKLYVMMLPGWSQSKGVAKEIDTAIECDIPIEFISP
jgi:hypothetical protein